MRSASSATIPALELAPLVEPPTGDATHKIDEAAVDRHLDMENTAPDLFLGDVLKLPLTMQDLPDVELHAAVIAEQGVDGRRERGVVGEDLGVEPRGLGGPLVTRVQRRRGARSEPEPYEF